MLNKPKYLIIHHTGGTKSNPLTDTSHHTFEIIDNYHKSLGWEGFGYHYLIEKDGKLRKGRPDNYHGAHCRGYNTQSLGICLSGNFDVLLPTEAQTETLRGLLSVLILKYDIQKSNILPHRHFTNKSCYGRKLSDTWAQDLLKNDLVKEKLSTIIKDLQDLFKML